MLSKRFLRQFVNYSETLIVHPLHKLLYIHLITLCALPQMFGKNKTFYFSRPDATARWRQPESNRLPQFAHLSRQQRPSTAAARRLRSPKRLPRTATTAAEFPVTTAAHSLATTATLGHFPPVQQCGRRPAAATSTATAPPLQRT